MDLRLFTNLRGNLPPTIPQLLLPYLILQQPCFTNSGWLIMSMSLLNYHTCHKILTYSSVFEYEHEEECQSSVCSLLQSVLASDLETTLNIVSDPRNITEISCSPLLWIPIFSQWQTYLNLLVSGGI